MSEDRERYLKITEAVLFAAGDSVSPDQLSKALELKADECASLARELQERYNAEDRGMQILELEGRFQMTTRPIYYEQVKRLYRAAQKIHLTDTQLETLAIVAYKQPVTKQQVDDIRGVHSDAVIDRLVEFDLIGEVGRLKVPGRPLLLGTTENFLRNFGFSSIRDIPDLPPENIEMMEQLELDEAAEFDEIPEEEKGILET